MKNRNASAIIVGASIALTASLAALAQDTYPNKPVRTDIERTAKLIETMGIREEKE